MKTQVKFEINGKHKEKGNLTQRLFGFVRAVHKNTEPIGNSTQYNGEEALRKYDVYAGLRTAEVIMFMQRRQLAIQ